jgi:hypothetical protein
MEECDGDQEDEWPNDDEANDIMLAYASEEDTHGTGSGCAGVITILVITLLALLNLLF